MKYVKTFENFSEEMEGQEAQGMAQGEVKYDLSSPEVQDELAKLAEEEGADVDLVLQTADELANEPVKYNEEEEPFPTLMEWGQVGLALVALVAGVFGFTKLRSNQMLKRYIQYKAEEEVKAAIKADPNLIKASLKIGLLNEKISFLEDIIKSLVNRGFQIKSAIDWEKFKVGI
jgi:hypothetical protein